MRLTAPAVPKEFPALQLQASEQLWKRPQQKEAVSVQVDWMRLRHQPLSLTVLAQ